MRIELLVDSDEFWTRFQDDLSAARDTAYVQTFSFEGDRVGSALGRRLEACGARDRRLLVDSYSLLYHNDRLIQGLAWAERAFRREVFSTHRWVRRLRARGVGIRFGNPLGPSPVNLLRRSHKKLAVFDGRVAYLGGINFCEHNFAWHDMMLRVEDRMLALHLEADFRASWDGRPTATDVRSGPLRVVSLNGRGNPRGFAPLLGALEGVLRSVDIVSAYLSPPFTDVLGRAAERGVRVRLLTPARNNKPNLARHALSAARRHAFQVMRYPGRMNHMKAMVLDDELLVAGSSNFDFMSYHILEELFVLTRDRDVLDAFRRRVWNVDTSCARAVVHAPSLGTRLGHGAVVLGSILARSLALPQDVR